MKLWIALEDSFQQLFELTELRKLLVARAQRNLKNRWADAPSRDLYLSSHFSCLTYFVTYLLVHLLSPSYILSTPTTLTQTHPLSPNTSTNPLSPTPPPSHPSSSGAGASGGRWMDADDSLERLAGEDQAEVAVHAAHMQYTAACCALRAAIALCLEAFVEVIHSRKHTH